MSNKIAFVAVFQQIQGVMPGWSDMVSNLHKTIIFWGLEAEILDLETSILYIFALRFLNSISQVFGIKSKNILAWKCEIFQNC